MSDEERPFFVGSWNGLPNYECKLCRFATIDQTGFLGHLRTVHKVDFVFEKPSKKKPALVLAETKDGE